METLKFNVFNFLNKSKKTTVPLGQWFPTGGSRTPGGPKQDFR